MKKVPPFIRIKGGGRGIPLEAKGKATVNRFPDLSEFYCLSIYAGLLSLGKYF